MWLSWIFVLDYLDYSMKQIGVIMIVALAFLITGGLAGEMLGEDEPNYSHKVSILDLIVRADDISTAIPIWLDEDDQSIAESDCFNNFVKLIGQLEKSPDGTLGLTTIEEISIPTSSWAPTTCWKKATK